MAFATAHQWVNRLGAGQHAGTLDGYIPFAREAAALFFALIRSRYEKRSLMVIAATRPSVAWAEISGGGGGYGRPPGASYQCR